MSDKLSNAETEIIDVSAVMEEMSAAMEESSASLDQVNGSIREIFESIESIYKQAENGKTSSDRIMKTASEVYHRAVEEKQDAVRQVADMAASVQQKIEKSKSVEAIRDLTSETAIGGYEKLLETSEGYHTNVGNMNEMMQRFAEESRNLKTNMDGIRTSVEDLKTAVNESTLGVSSVTETAVSLTGHISDIGKEAESNLEIVDRLNLEVGKFKL